jgi:two-component system cell cycle response regulator
MIDIDFFKSVNDKYGHPAGDAVLKEVSQRIFNGIRPSDFFVRMGGEEFAIVMPETELRNAEKIAERIRLKIAEYPFEIPGSAEKLKVTISIGVAETRPDKNDTPNKIFDRADTALLLAKKKGRNCVVIDTGA